MASSSSSPSPEPKLKVESESESEQAQTSLQSSKDHESLPTAATPKPSSETPPPHYKRSPPRSLLRRLQLAKFLRLLVTRINAQIAHLNRLTTSTSHLDALLSTLYYTLHLLAHSSLRFLPRSSFLALTTIISSTRTTLRLLGLLPIHTWALSTLSSPPSNPILRAILQTQVLACATYQVLENVSFLAERGVLSVEKRRAEQYGRWSCRAWMLFVALEGGRLGYEWLKWGQEDDEKSSNPAVPAAPNEHKELETINRDKWWRDAILNSAYAPMTLHWSTQDGVLNETWIGVLGLVAGVVGLRQAWRETA